MVVQKCLSGEKQKWYLIQNTSKYTQVKNLRQSYRMQPKRNIFSEQKVQATIFLSQNELDNKWLDVNG